MIQIKETVAAINEVQFQLLAELSDFDIKRTYERMMKVGIDDKSKGFWIWDLKSNVEIYSPKFRASLGYEGPEDFPNVPKSWQDAIDPKDKKIALSNFDKHAKSGGEFVYSQKVTYHKKYGGTIDVVCHGKIVAWEGDKPTVVIGIHLNTNGTYSD